jgi:hypothetical protein
MHNADASCVRIVRFSNGKSDIEGDLSQIYAAAEPFDSLIATSRTVSGKRSGSFFVFRRIYRAECVDGNLSQLVSASDRAVFCFHFAQGKLSP